MNTETRSTKLSLQRAPLMLQGQPRRKRLLAGVLAGLGVAAFLLVSVPALAATAPPLGVADSFGVLAASAVSNTGASVINGDLGISPNNMSSITGFPPGSVTGTTHAADGVALQAQLDTTTAYNNLAGQASDADLTGQDLGGMTLSPGVYTYSTSAQLTGTVTLDAAGDPNAVFVFQIGSTLTTASNSTVNVINGGSLCNVFWQVGSSATLGTGTAFAGNILALESITMTTGANMTGRALARTGAVTMDTGSAGGCAAADTTVQITKVSNGGVGTFGFTGTNGIGSHNIVTMTPGVGVAGAIQTLTAAGVSTSITESAPPAGYALASISCSGLGTGGTATPNIAARTVTLDTAATAAGAAISCTFTNTLDSNTITVNKDFIPNSTATVPVALTCTSGTVTATPLNASEASPAVFTVTGASTGTICTATETVVPAGYTVDQAGCAAVVLGGSCTITNTLIGGVMSAMKVPTLNQYGMAILALLMLLGVGFISFRRFT